MTLTTFSGRNPSQNQFELLSFIMLLQRHGVKSYLEVGAREGDTFVEVMTHLPRGSKGVAVDLPGGLWGKLTTRGKLEEAIKHLDRHGYNVSCLFGNSQEAATRKLVQGRGTYDAILIDGDHTFKGVEQDFLNYKDLADIVAFHDIVGTGQAEKVHGNLVEVPLFWEVVKKTEQEEWDFLEFVDEGSKMGIGVMLRKDPDEQH